MSSAFLRQAKADLESCRREAVRVAAQRNHAAESARAFHRAYETERARRLSAEEELSSSVPEWVAWGLGFVAVGIGGAWGVTALVD